MNAWYVLTGFHVRMDVIEIGEWSMVVLTSRASYWLIWSTFHVQSNMLSENNGIVAIFGCSDSLLNMKLDLDSVWKTSASLFLLNQRSVHMGGYYPLDKVKHKSHSQHLILDKTCEKLLFRLHIHQFLLKLRAIHHFRIISIRPVGRIHSKEWA